MNKFYYSLNMSGRSAFVATSTNIDPDMEETDSVVADAIKQGLIDQEDADEIVCIATMTESEYNHAMGIKTTIINVGDTVDVTANEFDSWTGMIYQAKVTKIVGNTITIEYSNDDEGDVCWEVDADQCVVCD